MNFQFRWFNAFWYFALYGLISYLIMRFFPPKKRKKILFAVSAKKTKDQVFIMISRILKITAMFFSLFIPIQSYNIVFCFGNALYLAGLIFSSVALYQFARADAEQLVSDGLYQFTRHPMQVFFYIMCFGILLIAQSTILTLLVLGYMFTFYPAFALQESFCRKKFGNAYIEYQRKTPRFLFVNAPIERRRK